MHVVSLEKKIVTQGRKLPASSITLVSQISGCNLNSLRKRSIIYEGNIFFRLVSCPVDVNVLCSKNFWRTTGVRKDVII